MTSQDDKVDSDLDKTKDAADQQKSSSENTAIQEGVNEKPDEIPVENELFHGFKVDDPLGLLQSKHIAAAAVDASNACNNDKARKRKYKSEDERLEANRRSAAESRLRKKILMEKLQESICVLQEENTRLKVENEMLKQQMNLNNNHMLQFNSNVIPSVLNARNPSPNMLTEHNRMNGANINAYLNSGGLAQSNLPFPVAGSPVSSQIFDSNQIDNSRNIVATLLRNSLGLERNENTDVVNQNASTPTSLLFKSQNPSTM